MKTAIYFDHDHVEAATARSTSAKTPIMLVLICAAGTVLRLHLLSQKSLWIDEATSVALARLHWYPFFRQLWHREANMVSYYLLLRGWIHIGDTEFAIRCLSVAFGVATIPATYVLGKYLFGRRVGLVSAALLSVHAFHIWYSQEARSYSLLALLAVMSTYFFARAVESPQKRHWAAYVLISALAVYTHIFAVLVLTAQWVSLGVRRLRQLSLSIVVITLESLALLIMPMAGFVLLHLHGPLDWVPKPTLGSVLELVNLLMGNAGVLLLAGYGISSAVPLFLIWTLRRSTSDDEKWHVRLIYSWFIFPLASMLLISVIKPILEPRYTVMCIPALTLIAAYGIEKCYSAVGARIGAVAVLLMIIASLWGTHRYYASFPEMDEDWRSATHYILKQQEAGDAVVFYIPNAHSFNYYARREMLAHEVASLPDVIYPSTEFTVPPIESIETAAEHYSRLWLVLHYEESDKAGVAGIADLVNGRFQRRSDKTFSGSPPITVALYVRLQ